MPCVVSRFPPSTGFASLPLIGRRFYDPLGSGKALVVLILAAWSFAACGSGSAATGLHWTARAAPGYQHVLRRHGSPTATCRKRSPTLVVCHATMSGLPATIRVVPRTRTRARYTFVTPAGTRTQIGRVSKGWIG